MTRPEDEARRVARELLRRHGRSYAEEAGIRLSDRPAPLYQLLVLANLLSARISAEIAVAATRELLAAGYRTPAKMAAASWQDRVDALGRGHYKRYDERTSTMLGGGAELIQQQWRGDLRRLHREAGDDVAALQSGLTRIPGIGPTGAVIFLREVQGVWTGIAPFLDAKVRSGAERLGLPTQPDRLAALVRPDQLPSFAAALVRAALDRSVAREPLQAARGAGS